MSQFISSLYHQFIQSYTPMMEEKVNPVVDENEVGSISSSKAVNIILENTKDLVEEERQLGVIEAMKMYPKAMFWSIFFSVAVIMTGYDAQLITSFFAMPSFIAKYGQYYNGKKEISAAWQSGLGMGNPIGQLLGSLVVAWPSEKWGRKRVLIVCNLLIAALIFMQFFAKNIQVLCAGEILAGLLWGCFVVIAPSYASEVSPLALRGILTAFINMAFVIGQFVAQGVAAGLEQRTDQWAYRAPFAIQWVWCLILFVGLPFAPESPWFLVRSGRREDAKKSLQKLAWDKAGVDLDKTLNIIEQTDLLERELHTSSTYADCFKGNNLRRTEICCMVYLIQVICGNPLMGYCNYFFLQAGLNTSEAFNMGVGLTGIGFVGTALTWVVLSFAGRRTIYNYGLYAMTMLLFIIAILDCAPSYDSNRGFSWAQASLLSVWTFLYQLTVGPLTFVLIGEISSTKLRSRTYAVATAAQALCTIVTTVAVPYMFNPANGNMRGKIGFFFGGLSLLSCVWCFFRLPETQKRSFEELDIMFERKVSTRDFKHYDAFEN